VLEIKFNKSTYLRFVLIVLKKMAPEESFGRHTYIFVYSGFDLSSSGVG